MNARQWGLGDSRRIATRDFPPAVLALVGERQGGRFCVSCRALAIQTPPSEPLQIDHLQPLSQGGDNHHLNLRWLCRAHNCGRGARKEETPQQPKWARTRSRGSDSDSADPSGNDASASEAGATADPAGLLVLMRGIPGAGKSTYAKTHFPGALTLTTDSYFVRADGSYRFDRARLGEAHESCLLKFRVALKLKKTPIVVDKCNLSWRAIEPYAVAARKANYEIRVVTLLADPRACWRRNVHRVPQAKIFELAKILSKVRLPAWVPSRTIRTDPVMGSPAVQNSVGHPFWHWPTRGAL